MHGTGSQIIGEFDVCEKCGSRVLEGCSKGGQCVCDGALFEDLRQSGGRIRRGWEWDLRPIKIVPDDGSERDGVPWVACEFDRCEISLCGVDDE